ncbi:hypothetical protein REPUB_Repub04eG0002200 [Reevesia pubescens]
MPTFSNLAMADPPSPWSMSTENVGTIGTCTRSNYLECPCMVIGKGAEALDLLNCMVAEVSKSTMVDYILGVSDPLQWHSQVFPDAQLFLRWAREKGLKVGIISNAEYRYQDVILPALGLNQGSEWDFGVFSGLEGVEKPDPRIYKIALERAGNIAPEETMHIGDSMRKDYVPAKSVGMNALLL